MHGSCADAELAFQMRCVLHVPHVISCGSDTDTDTDVDGSLGGLGVCEVGR